jgi:hypothetical protein
MIMDNGGTLVALAGSRAMHLALRSPGPWSRRRAWCLAILAALMVPVASARAQHAGHAGEQFGEVHFPISCGPQAQQQFDRGVALLHSFFFPETSKAFAAMTQSEPDCAMGYWGLAMSQRPNPLIGALPPELNKRGWEMVEKAKAASIATPRERDYIAALETYYSGYDTIDHHARTVSYAKAMEQVHQRYPDDAEAAIFYALALNEATDLADKTFANQMKAGAILESVLETQPNHPGVAHYIIHTYDYPPLAERGLRAARMYADLAPSAPHALHMPSHIFSMLGMWDDLAKADTASLAVAQAYSDKNFGGAANAGILHSMDFLTYAYLQEGRDKQAAEIVERRNAIAKFVNRLLPGDTALAAIPVRFAIETGRWSQAAALRPVESEFPAAVAISYFGRGYGAARLGDAALARASLDELVRLREKLIEGRNAYWSEQVEIQRLAASAWLAHAEQNSAEAVKLMRAAADLEDRSEKHIAMENRLIPMRELLGEMLLESNEPAIALNEFEVSLQHASNRFRSFFGAAQAAQRANDSEKAKVYYQKLVALATNADGERPELAVARQFLAAN